MRHASRLSVSAALCSAALLCGHHAVAQPTEPPADAPATGTLPPVEPAPPPADTAPVAPPPPPPVGAAPAQAPPPGPAYGPPPAYGYPPQEPPLPPAPKEPEPRDVSVTLSPLHLIFPVLELTAELRVVDGFGVSVLGGYGSISVEDSLKQEVRFRVFEIGGQLSWYPLKPFDSLNVGAELVYLNVDTDELNDAKVSGVAEGVTIGPFVGYKLVTSGGFTFLAQGGFQYLAYEAEARDSSGNSAQESDSRWGPLLNLNIGWSF